MSQIEELMSLLDEVVPKHRYREGDIPSRTLPRVAIPNGKPFHPHCPGYGSDGKKLGGKCSDLDVLKVHRSFWDDLDHFRKSMDGDLLPSIKETTLGAIWVQKSSLTHKEGQCSLCRSVDCGE